MSRNATPHTTGKYLDARITTASQPELQLILLDGALRFGRQALPLLGDAARTGEADSHLSRTLDIVEELVHSVAAGTNDAAKRLEEEYAFAFRQLAVAQLNRDAAALQSVLSLLEFQRETWKLACENAKAATSSAAVPAAQSYSPHAAFQSHSGFAQGSPGLSLEA